MEETEVHIKCTKLKEALSNVLDDSQRDFMKLEACADHINIRYVAEHMELQHTRAVHIVKYALESDKYDFVEEQTYNTMDGKTKQLTYVYNSNKPVKSKRVQGWSAVHVAVVITLLIGLSLFMGILLMRRKA